MEPAAAREVGGVPEVCLTALGTPGRGRGQEGTEPVLGEGARRLRGARAACQAWQAGADPALRPWRPAAGRGEGLPSPAPRGAGRRRGGRERDLT